MDSVLDRFLQHLHARALVLSAGFNNLGGSVRHHINQFLQYLVRVFQGTLTAESGIGGHDDLKRERGQAVVRLMNAVLVLAYATVYYYPVRFDTGYPDWLLFGAGFIAISALMLVLTFRATRPSALRRLAGNVGDVSAISYGMIIAGEIGIPLFVLYLSVTIGNGLRFGARAMTVSALLCLVGFSIVLALSPVWQELVTATVAIMAMLAVLPFSARFMRHAVTARTTQSEKVGSARLVGKDQLAELPLLRRVRLLLPSFNSKHTGELRGAQKVFNTNSGTEHRSAGSEAGNPLPRRLLALFSRLRRKRLDELGREQGQAVVRLVNSLFVFAYLLIFLYPIDLTAGYPHWILFSIGFIGFSALVVMLTLYDTASSIARRIVGNVGDVCAVSYVMIATGTAGIPLFILYLSITLGNGFRFGLQALIVSAILCVVGFSAVVVLSPPWHELPVSVPVAVTLALLLLPAYTAHLINQLAKATKRAEEASAARGRFLARMSHELRTPLNGILGTTELLSNSKRLTRDDRSLLDIIRDSVKVSMRQIDNVLDFSKIEAGKLIIEQVNFDLHALLNRAIRVVRAAALEKNLRLTLRIDPAIPSRLIGDPHHLHEVFLNLLSNAIKFTENGYVSLEAHLASSDEDSALLRFEVHDTGIGIEPGAIARIFEAFTQEDGGTTRRYGGTGLGTTIAKQLVELMGGRLKVESTKGKGTKFYADIQFLRQKEAEETDAVLAGLRVLLLSEESALTAHLGALMDGCNISLSTVSSVSEAIGLLARGIRVGNPINVILADSRAVFTSNGNHCAGDFLDKAWLSSTPVFLFCDVSPGEAQLREWGYAAVLSYAAPRPVLFSALRSSNASDIVADQGVVQVEPWAWRQQGGRSRPRLLIADDNRTNLMILRRILEGAGYEVDTAENGEEALEVLMRDRYKVAVIDMHMPGLDGVEVIKQYRMMQRGAKTPIIMLTANATIDAKLESAEAGADAYLTKPATAAAVLSTIKKILEDREVHELKHDHSRAAQAAADVSVLDTEVVTELARLYNAPQDLSRLLDTFESESGRLLRELQGTIAKKNHAAFCELIHALKGNGANVGASRLAQTCLEIESTGLLDFYREGKHLVSRIENAFAEAVQALREHTSVSHADPARGSDIH